jgi:murein DD-endopeptidase MepM/ murein hydrolase activator NlpD
MRALAGRSRLLRTTLPVVLTLAVWSALSALPALTPPAVADDRCDDAKGDPADERRLEAASEERTAIQRKLNALLDQGELLRAQIEETDAEHAALVRRQHRFDRQAGAAADELADRVRRSYMLRNADPVLTMLAATDASSVVEQSRMLGLLAEDSRSHVELASNAARRNRAAADQAERVAAELGRMQREFGSVEQKTRRLLAEAEQTEAELASKVALQRAAKGSRCALPGGSVSGGLACPVDQPRSYSDTYGAPRSGGRSHLGVDILAPHGTPLRAYESGTISRMHSNSLGGISLYLQGASGNEYYYTHLSGYVSGLSTGQHVTAGQHIGFVGDTGNAAGIPHLHWEVFPGGGGNANPYPYASSACG